MSKTKGTSVFAVLSVLVLLLGVEAWGEPSMSIDTATGRIMIRAERQQIQEVEGAIAEFPFQARQIQIKARLLELSEEATREFGIHLERLTGVKVPSGETGEGTGTELGKLIEEGVGLSGIKYAFYRLTAGEEKLEAIIKALVETDQAELLLEPEVSTLSGQVAGIYVVTRVPYKVSEAVATETAVIPEKWEYATVGIVLQVLPEIVAKDLVQMSIVLAVSDWEQFEPGHPIFRSDIERKRRKPLPVFLFSLIFPLWVISLRAVTRRRKKEIW